MDNQQASEPHDSDVVTGTVDRSTFHFALQEFQDVFAAIATQGYYVAVVSAAQNPGLTISAWADRRTFRSRTFTKSMLSAKRSDCQCSWEALFSWLDIRCLRAATYTSGTLELHCPPDLTRPALRGPMEFELDEGYAPTQMLWGVLYPLIQTHTRLKRRSSEDTYAAMELERGALRSTLLTHELHQQALQAEIPQLEEGVLRAQNIVQEAKEQAQGMMRVVLRMRIIAESGDGDHLYPNRPAVYQLHVRQAKQHIPMLAPYNPHALHQLRLRHTTHGPAPDLPPEDTLHETILQQLGGIDSWDYDVFGLQHSSKGLPLFFTTLELLHQYGLVSHFQINETTLHHFLQAVEAGYQPNHYHNNIHAADVVQCVHYILTRGGLKKLLNLLPCDLLAAILSAAVHDYDHPGFNNNFHVKTQAYLAILYNDRSVLENHHLASVFELTKYPRYNIFDSLTADQFKDVRDTMTEMVLATDMGLHGNIVQKFRSRLGENKPWGSRLDQRLALSIALKMADISNCCRSPQFYNRWSRSIMKEFYLQGDAERALGFPISPFMDRANEATEFVQGQVSFMNYIVIPLAESVSELLPDMTFAVELCRQNRQMMSGSVQSPNPP